MIRAVAMLMTIALTACLQSTAPQAPTIPVTGSWRYTATQTGAMRETLAGTLSIGRQSGSAFQGSIEIVGTSLVTGETRTLSGTLSGEVPSADAVDFDASLEVSPRRHVGRLVADTIVGTWVGTSANGTISGVFRAERLRN
ncbi:MAG TPA: hypothetical protein VIF83_12030 [Gemmatimonadaceae bacterium]